MSGPHHTSFSVSLECLNAANHTNVVSTHTHTLLLKAFMLLHLVFFYAKSDLRQKFRPRLQSHLNTPDQSLRGLICPNGLFSESSKLCFSDSAPRPARLFQTLWFVLRFARRSVRVSERAVSVGGLYVFSVLSALRRVTGSLF